MHTFFVNTAEDLLDNDIVEKYLFVNLKYKNKLIYYNESLRNLSVCAHKICDIIDKDERIGANFNLIIYIDLPNSPTKSDADVDEEIYMMSVNENFASVLKSKDKTAQNIQVIFGEHFDRGQDLGANDLDEGRLWTKLGFPSREKVQDWIDKLATDAYNHETSCSQLKTEFKNLQKAENATSIIGMDSKFYEDLLDVMIDRFIGIIEQKIENIPVEIDLERELSTVFSALSDTEKRENVYHNFNSLPLYVRNPDVPMVSSRCTYQLYLYVYYCATHDTIFTDCEMLPDPNWVSFANILATRKMELNEECANVREITNKFDALNTDNFCNKDLVPISEPLPKLTQDGPKLTFFMTVKELKKQQNTIFSDLKSKNNTNADNIDSFITKIRGIYIRDKGKVMKGVKRKKEERTRSIDPTDIKPIREEAKKLKKTTDGKIAGQKYLQTENIDFQKQNDKASQKIDCYIACITLHWWFMLLLIVIWGVFAIPYLWIQHSDLSYYGYGMFWRIIGIIAVIFVCAYIWFYCICKMRIKGVILDIVKWFNRKQRPNIDNLTEFKSRLTELYPQSNYLRSYHDDVVKHISGTKDFNDLRAYHIRYLREFDRYIDETIRRLEIGDLITNNGFNQNGFKLRLTKNTIKYSAPQLVKLYFIMDRDKIEQVIEE